MSDPARDTERQRLDVAPCRLPERVRPPTVRGRPRLGFRRAYYRGRPWKPCDPRWPTIALQDRSRRSHLEKPCLTRYLVNHEEECTRMNVQ